MFNLAKRIIKQIIGDRSLIALIIVAPLIILFLLSLLLGKNDYVPTIGIVNVPTALQTQMETHDANLVDVDSTDYENYLNEHKNVDAVFVFSPTGSDIYIYEASQKSQEALAIITDSIEQVNSSFSLNTYYVIGSTDDSTFDNYGYVFLGFVAFFISFIISGMSLVKERSKGSLERLLMTPIRRRDVILGYNLGFGFFAVFQSVLMVIFAIYVLNLDNRGPIYLILIAQILLALLGVAFGELVSSVVSSEFQVAQMIPLLIVPQIFFTGIIPLDTMPYGLGNLCYVMPIYYGSIAIKHVIVYGENFAGVWMYLLAMLGYIAMLLGLNTVILKRYRNI